MMLVIVAINGIKITVHINNTGFIDMKKASTLRPVLLTASQMEAIRSIQESERKNSRFGTAPTVHDIARGLISRALENAGVHA